MGTRAAVIALLLTLFVISIAAGMEGGKQSLQIIQIDRREWSCIKVHAQGADTVCDQYVRNGQ